MVEQRWLTGWLTMVVTRVCLDMLRSRRSGLEDVSDGHFPTDASQADLDQRNSAAEAMLADAVGAALLAALDSLSPAERFAFVLHDLFAVPFDEIAPIVGQSPEAARRLVTTARRRVQNPTLWSL